MRHNQALLTQIEALCMAKCIIRGNNIYTMQMQAFGRQNPRYATNVGKHAGICKKIQD